MKILNIVSAIDLTYGFGCTPAWWQLFKALYELEHENIVIPYYGQPVETLWWTSYENPGETESYAYVRLAGLILQKFQSKRRLSKPTKLTLGEKLARKFVQPRWEKTLNTILQREKDIDAIIFYNIPLTHLTGLPRRLKKRYNTPVIFFDGDMPAVFPKYADSSRFLYGSYYINVNLTEYDAIIVNSEGVISDLKEMGANSVHVIHYAADPEVYKPIKFEKQDIDAFFYGHGARYRERWIKNMIITPSKRLPDAIFAVGGRNFRAIFLGNARDLGPVPFSIWRRYCCQSKINLNITRHAHANVYASSTSRPFELAAMGCCIVSNPVNGLEKWFDINNEILIIKDENEAVETYKWLLASDETRRKIGEAARARVLKEHTFQHRARQLINIVRKLK